MLITDPSLRFNDESGSGTWSSQSSLSALTPIHILISIKDAEERENFTVGFPASVHTVSE